MISIIIAADQPTLRIGLHAVLKRTYDLRIVAEAEHGYAVQKLVEQLRPQVLLLDLLLPGPRPVEIEKWMRNHCSPTKTLVLAEHDWDIDLAETMAAGGSGYILKNESTERIIAAIRTAAQGEKLFTKEQYARVLEWHESVGNRWENLTERERQVLQLLVRGLDNVTIACSLNITAKTVEHHITNILEKLGLDSAKEVISWVNKNLLNDRLASHG